MQPVNVHQAKTQLSQLLHLVEQGEEVVIARAGHDVSAGPPRARRRDVLRHTLAVLWRQRRRA